MNLLLLEADDFVGEQRVRLAGRRLAHVRKVHGAIEGDDLRVGLVGGKIGRGRIERIDENALEMNVQLDIEPPKPLPLRLVLQRFLARKSSIGLLRRQRRWGFRKSI